MKTDDQSAGEFRRILVALDASPYSTAALEAAMELAVSMRAEVLGMFVEDINLLRFAELPIAKEVVYASSSARALDPLRMERALKAQAERVRRQLQLAAERSGARWSFQVRRGRVDAELLAHTPDVDLLILGRAGHSPRSRRAIGSTARAVVAQAGCAVFLTHHGAAIERPVVALYDGTPASTRALGIAARLAHHDDRNLAVLIPRADMERLRPEVEAVLGTYGLQACLRPLDVVNAEYIAAAVEMVGGKLLVAGSDGSDAETSRLPELLDRPVIVVRSASLGDPLTPGPGQAA